MHILFVTSNYPTPSEPNRGTFVRQLVRTIAEKNVKCSVICPVSVSRKKNQTITKLVDDTIKGNPITVIYPRYLSLSNKKILSFNTFRLTQYNFNKSVFSALSQLEGKPTVVYGHFLYPGGYTSIKIGKILEIPSVVAVGESGTTLIKNVEKCIGLKRSIKNFRGVSGIVSVSNQNTVYCNEKLKIPIQHIREFPNGIDNLLFYPRDKKEMRLKYNLPSDKIIVAFTGQFIERKGPNRLLQAIQGIKDIGVIFIGKGPIHLEGDPILFKGVLHHEQVPEFLSTADMFVLPTLAEGSCNAIIEAMGCGLPIISSNGKFNDDILNDEVSIRVDPMNVEEIRKAIIYLYENKKKRILMGEKAHCHSSNFNIENRAKNILDWIKEIQNRYHQKSKSFR